MYPSVRSLYVYIAGQCGGNVSACYTDVGEDNLSVASVGDITVTILPFRATPIPKKFIATQGTL